MINVSTAFMAFGSPKITVNRLGKSHYFPHTLSDGRACIAYLETNNLFASRFPEGSKRSLEFVRFLYRIWSPRIRKNTPCSACVKILLQLWGKAFKISFNNALIPLEIYSTATFPKQMTGSIEKVNSGVLFFLRREF